MTRTVKVSEFKAKCLKLLAEVADSGEEVVVTKRGKVLARVVPDRGQKPTSLQGAMKGLIEVLTPDKTLPSPWDDDGGQAGARRTERLAANLEPDPRTSGAED